MSFTAASQQAASVKQPNHPLHALTSHELRDYRRDLKRAIAFYGKESAVPPARNSLQARLDEVIAEQDDRTRLAADA